jgi:hypothetical protein
MQAKVVKMIKHFLKFLQAYDSHQVQNMFALLLNPRFKPLEVVENYVGCEASYEVANDNSIKLKKH